MRLAQTASVPLQRSPTELPGPLRHVGTKGLCEDTGTGHGPGRGLRQTGHVVPWAEAGPGCAGCPLPGLRALLQQPGQAGPGPVYFSDDDHPAPDFNGNVCFQSCIAKYEVSTRLYK